MATYKPIIEINKNNKDDYRILNGLRVNREYHIKKLDDNKRKLLVKIGQATSNFKSTHPVIWHPPRRNDETRLLKLPPEIDIDEKISSDKISFPFIQRRKII